MSFDLSQFDQNVRIEDRLWNLHATAPKDFQMSLDGREVFLLVLSKDTMGGSARAFDMIDRTDSRCGLRAALLQFILRTVELVIVEHNKSAKEGKHRLPYPIEMWLETVVESEESARTHADKFSSGDIRDVLIRRFYKTTTNPAIEAPAVPSSDSFLADCKKRSVIEYRLWVAVSEHVNFPKKLEAVLNLAMIEYDKRTAATTLSSDNKLLREYKKTTGDDPSTTDFSMAKILKPDEQWALIHSPSAMLDAIAVYTRNRRFLSAQVRSQALSAAHTLGDSENPAYLGGVFSAMMQFPISDRRIDETQRTFLKYYVTNPNDAKERSFRFPHPNRVLVVPASLHGRQMIKRYVPDYQARQAENRMLHENYVRAQYAIATAVGVRPAASNDDDDNAHLAGGNGVFDPRRSQSQDVDASDISDLDEQNRIAAQQYLPENCKMRLERPPANETVAERNAIDSMILGSRYVDPIVHAQRKALAFAQSGNITRSTLDQMAYDYRTVITDKIERAPTLKDRCIAYTHLQRTAIDDYVAACTNPLADVSQRGRVINQFMHQAELEHKNSFMSVKFFDRQLSVFGHMVVREMTVMDEVYHTHSIHALQLAMQIALMDSYRVAHDLHYHLLVTGPPDLGKSRGIDVTEMRAIWGTVDVVSRHTAKSHSAEESINDKFEALHEAPRAWLIDPIDGKVSGFCLPKSGGGKNESSDAEQHEQFKAKTVSMMVRVVESRRQPDGSFKQITRVSEQIQTYALVSNIDRDLVADAILSRFWSEVIADFHRRDCTISEKTLNEKNESRALKVRRQREDMQFRLLQALYYHVEKLIYFNALTKPTLAAFSVLSPIFVRVMAEHGIRVPVRSLVKMELIVRHMVIRRAIFMLYSAPMAPFKGADVSINHLARLDPWLYDDTEIVLWTFQFARSQFIDPHGVVVARALRRYMTERCATPSVFERYRTAYAPVRRHAIQVRLPRENLQDIRNYLSAEMIARGKALEETWQTVKPDDQTFDWNRITLRQNHVTLAVELQAIIAETETIRMTKDQIVRVLVVLANQTVTDYPYLPNAAFDGKISDQSFPVLPDKTKQKTSSLAVIVDLKSKIVSIHVSVLMLLARDPIDAVIAACCDANVPRKKMLSGKPHAPDLPHLFGTYTPTPNPNVVHIVPNRTDLLPSTIAFMGDQDDQTDGSDVLKDAAAQNYFKMNVERGKALDMPLDEYAVRRRMDDIHLPQEACAAFSFRAIEAQIAAKPVHYVAQSRQINYPDTSQIDKMENESIDGLVSIISSRPREEAARLLRGRISFLVSNMKDDLQKAQVQNLLRDCGYNVEIAQAFVDRSEERRAEIEREIIARQEKEHEAERADIDETREHINRVIQNKRAKVGPDEYIYTPLVGASTSTSATSQTSNAVESAPPSQTPIRASSTQQSSSSSMQTDPLQF